MTKKYLQFILLISAVHLFCFHSNASEKQDSILISNYFEKLNGSIDSVTLAANNYKEKVAKNDLHQFYYQYSKYLLQHGQIDASKTEANKGINLFKKDTLNPKIVKLFNMKAAALSLKKEYVEAINLFNKSIQIAELLNNKKQSAYLQNNIANIFFSLQDYYSAYKYAKRSYDNIQTFPEDPYHNQILSVLSVAEAKIGKTDEAEIHANKALNDALELNDIPAVIIAQYALGDISQSQKNLMNAKKYFLNSLALSESYQNYNFTMLNSVGLLTTSVELNEYSEAIIYGEKGLALAKALQNDNIQYSIFRHLGQAYYGVGDANKGYKYLLQAHSIYKATTNADNQEAINDILIKYDTEKKEKELARKNIQLLKQDARVSRAIQIILSLGILLIIVLFYFLFQRAKSKQLADKLIIENEQKALKALIQGEEIERTRIANELHDGLASSLTAVRFKLESFETNQLEERNELISMLRNTHEETRRIAHNLSPMLIEEYGLEKALRVYAVENAYANCTIESTMIGDASKISKEYAVLTYRFIQELVQNSLKHSAAQQISINVFCDSSEIRIIVEDDGIGFQLDLNTLQGGLLSLTKRIENLKGTIEINSTINRGTVVMIELPLLK